MSRKYPHENGAHNTAINNERKRSAHTYYYHSKHVQREMREAAQAKVEAFKQAEPEVFERLQQKKCRKPRSKASEGVRQLGF